MKSAHPVLLLLLFAFLAKPAGVTAAEHPNILIILADDMGYGDVHKFNPDSKIPTPNIDRLADQGMRFTDAHAPGSVCVPSRYGLMTGRYPFRGTMRPQKGVVVEPGRMTIASLLKQQGYTTAMVGKWHLGFEGGDAFDYSKALRGGPVDRGFDSFFGLHASTDIPPYFFIKNDHCVAAPTIHIEAHNTPGWSPIQGAFWREGLIAPGMKLEEVVPRITSESISFIEQHSKSKKKEPFFLYTAFTGPHTPWLPLVQYQGRTKVDLYGDFVTEVDDSVGKILKALERQGLSRNTLVFFSSDNGPVWFPENTQKFGHAAASIYRGMKGDAWEAGHRMPFIARWPGKIKAGTVSAQTICFTDFMATFAELTGAHLPKDAGEDSFSLLGTLLGKQTKPVHETMIITSARGVTAIRQGPWKLIPELGSGGFTKPSKIKPVAGGPTGQLYRLDKDPSEQDDLWLKEPAKVKELSALLEKYKQDGHTRPLE